MHRTHGLVLAALVCRELSSPASAQMGQACNADGVSLLPAGSEVATLAYPAAAGLYGINENCTWLFRCLPAPAVAAASTCNGTTVSLGRFAGQACNATYSALASESGTEYAQSWCQAAPNCTLANPEARITITFTAFSTENTVDTVRLFDGPTVRGAELTPGVSCWSAPLPRYYIGDSALLSSAAAEACNGAVGCECHPTLRAAQAACEAAADCRGIQQQAHVCAGEWSVRRGETAAAVRYYGSQTVQSMVLDRACVLEPGDSARGLSGSFNVLQELSRLQYTSSGPSMVMTFQSFGSNSLSGFSLEYQCGAAPALIGAECIDDPRCELSRFRPLHRNY